MPKPSAYNPNEPKNSQRRDVQHSSFGWQYWVDNRCSSGTGPVPHDVHHNQQILYAQQFSGQYSTRPQYPLAASSPYVHHMSSSQEASYSKQKDYHSSAPHRQYSSDYTPPPSSPHRREWHSKSAYEEQKGYHASAPQKKHSNGNPPYPSNVHPTTSHPGTSYKQSNKHFIPVPLRRYTPKRSTENYTQYTEESECVRESYDEYDERDDPGFDRQKYRSRRATESFAQYTKEPEPIPGSHEQYDGAEFERQKHKSREPKATTKSKKPTRSSRTEQPSDGFPQETKTTLLRDHFEDWHPPMGENRENSIWVKSAFDYLETAFSREENQTYLRFNPDDFNDFQLERFFAIVRIGSHIRESRIDASEEKDRQKEAFEGAVSKHGKGSELLNSLKEIATPERGRRFNIHICYEPEAKALRKILRRSKMDGKYCCSVSVSNAYQYMELYMNHKEADQDEKYFDNLDDWEKNQEKFQFVEFGPNYKQEGVYDTRSWNKIALESLPVRHPKQNPLILVREMLFGADVLGKNVGRVAYDRQVGCTVDFRDYLRSKGLRAG